MTVWLGIRKMCSIGRHVYLQNVVSLSKLYTNSTKRVVLVQSKHHLIKMQHVIAMTEKLLTWR
jgi:hypothetical protein